MPTFYRAALDTIASDVARTLRPGMTFARLLRPPITVINACAGFDRDMLLRDAIHSAAARYGMDDQNLYLVVAAEPDLVFDAVSRMVIAGSPIRILIVRDLLHVSLEEQHRIVQILYRLNTASAPCHVLTTTTMDGTACMSMQWTGHTRVITVDLSPRMELNMVIMARGAVSPGRSPMVRQLILRQWRSMTLLDHRSDRTFVKAVAEFTAEELGRRPLPWTMTDDDPVLLFAQALASLPPSWIRIAVEHLVERLINQPGLNAHSAVINPTRVALKKEARAALLQGLQRRSTSWNGLQMDQAVEVLSDTVLRDPETSPSPLEPSIHGFGRANPDAVFDAPISPRSNAPTIDLDAQNHQAVETDLGPMVHLLRQAWQRWCDSLASLGLTACRPPAVHATTSTVPSFRVQGLTRSETLAWQTLEPLASPTLPHRWVDAAQALIKKVITWPALEMREALTVFFDGLEVLSSVNAPAASPSNPRLSMVARHALLSACEHVPGWHDHHRAILHEALEPQRTLVYNRPASSTNENPAQARLPLIGAGPSTAGPVFSHLLR